MTIPRLARLVLRVAGAACLLAGLFPYYSHTVGPPPHAGVPPIEHPGAGVLGNRPSSTQIRLGLPSSPLFTYRRENRISTASQDTPAEGGTVKANVGEVTLSGAGTVVDFNAGLSMEWRLIVLSWSAALVALGAILLVAPNFVLPDRRSP